MEYPKQLTVNVTQEHIDAGEPCMSKLCPIARAIQDMFPDADLRVSNLELRLERRNALSTYSLPQKAVEFIRSFDMSGTGKPFTFECTLEWQIENF